MPLQTDAAKFGDSNDTLIVKLATAAQTLSGVANSDVIETQYPRIGQENSNLLRFAHAVQQL